MKDRTLDLDNYVPGLITFIGNKLTAQTSQMYREQFQVGAIEWRVLSILAIEDDLTVSDISRICGLDKAAIGRNVETLASRGLLEVRDDPTHGRRRLARLSADGRAQHDRILIAAIDNEQMLLACLDASEQTTLRLLLRKLHDRVDRIVADRPKVRPELRRE